MRRVLGASRSVFCTGRSWKARGLATKPTSFWSSLDSDTDPEYELPSRPTESWRDLDELFGDATVSWPSTAWETHPSASMLSCCGDFPELEANVGRLYPAYGSGPRPAFKRPTCVRLANQIFATAAHAVPQILNRRGHSLDGLLTMQYDFSNTAGSHAGPTAHTCVRLPLAELTQPDTCPLSGVEWRTPAHPSLLADLRFLRSEEPKPSAHAAGLQLASEVLRVGEPVLLCAFIRPLISAPEAWQWLQRASLETLSQLDYAPLLELRREGTSLKKDELFGKLIKTVCDPWAFALEEHCLDPRAAVHKIISRGEVLAVNDGGLIAVNNNSTVCSSGGAYVRADDPTKLVGIHLGLPRHSSVEHGNFNLMLSVLHPTFRHMYGTHVSD